jgi:hypothetical protein
LWSWPFEIHGPQAWVSVVGLGVVGSGIGLVLHYRLVLASAPPAH